MYLGAPAKPFPETVVVRLRDLVQTISGVFEAHIPQCYAPGVMKDPSQILVVITREGADMAAILTELEEKLHEFLPNRATLDVWPLGLQSDMVQAVRRANCPLL